MDDKTKLLLEQAIGIGLMRDRLDQKTAEELRKKDWKIVNNYAPVQKNRYLHALEDVMRQRTHDLRLTPLKSGLAAQENRGYNDGTSSSPVRVRAVDSARSPKRIAEATLL